MLARDIKVDDRIGDYIVVDCELLEGPLVHRTDFEPQDPGHVGALRIVGQGLFPSFEIVMVFLRRKPLGAYYAPEDQWRWYRADQEVTE